MHFMRIEPRVAWRLQNFQTGDVSSFLLRTPENLGVPVFFRVWHDNTGEGDKAGWFLAKVIVVDRQTKQWCVAQQLFYFFSLTISIMTTCSYGSVCVYVQDERMTSSCACVRVLQVPVPGERVDGA